MQLAKVSLLPLNLQLNININILAFLYLPIFFFFFFSLYSSFLHTFSLLHTMPIAGNPREVMWPTLVANKILRKRLGSSNFVADYPTTDDVITHVSSLEDHQPKTNSSTIFNPQRDKQEYKVFASTWNVGGIAPHDDLDMEELLDTSNISCDIYALGFQEIVPLNATNVLGSENNKVSMKWNSLIRKALNKKIHPKEKKNRDKDNQVSNYSPDNTSKDVNGNDIENNNEFHCIISKQMVGILISVWVRTHLCPYITNQSVSCVGCGILDCLGNKGSVSVRFELHKTRFCFVCTHLASGGTQKDEKHRNSNVYDILSRSTFPSGSSLDLPRKILDHDRVILLGDLNYRISLPEEATRLLVDTKQWDILLENDQLRKELRDGEVFEGWEEGAIKFAPTYKYCLNTDVYYGCLHGNKKRTPAWCDRIIWYGNGLKQYLYTRSESKLSDHRPVKTIFSVETDGFVTKLKRSQSLFEQSNNVQCKGKSSI